MFNIAEYDPQIIVLIVKLKIKLDNDKSFPHPIIFLSNTPSVINHQLNNLSRWEVHVMASTRNRQVRSNLWSTCEDTGDQTFITEGRYYVKGV